MTYKEIIEGMIEEPERRILDDEAECSIRFLKRKYPTLEYNNGWIYQGEDIHDEIWHTFVEKTKRYKLCSPQSGYIYECIIQSFTTKKLVSNVST